MSALIQLNAIRARAKEQLRSLCHDESLPANDESCLGAHDIPSGGFQSTSHDKDERMSNDSVVSNLGSYITMAGISLQTTKSGKIFYQVDWESPSDPFDPHNWPLAKRIGTLLLLDVIAATTTIASSIESSVAPQAAESYHAPKAMQSFSSTGTYLVGFGLGALLAAPASEILGRHAVYLSSLCICECWLIGSALAPNTASQAVFRFLAGIFASTPLTVAGGSMSDLWNTKEMTWTFPLFAVVGFGGPTLGPVIASYFGQSRTVSWRWVGWLMVILNGFCILFVGIGMEETFAPRLLQMKAKQFRLLTGNNSFKTAKENDEAGFGSIVKKNFTRPFLLALEPIVVFLTLYNTIAYMVLFTFLVGYPEIFEKTYGISQGLKNLCFLGLLVGILLSGALVPFVWKKTAHSRVEKGGEGSSKAIAQESRLLFAMFGAPLLPIGLFWMGWTSFPNISIWSPLAASVLIGFSTVCVFISSYMYMIDSYQTYAASALTFATIARYVIAGIMSVLGVTMYSKLGTHWALTMLGCIGVAVTPVPYVLYYYGNTIRGKSKFIV